LSQWVASHAKTFLVPSLWLLLALASALLLGFYDISKKLAVRDNVSLVVLFVATCAGLLCLAPLYVGSRIHLLPATSSLHVHEMDGLSHAYLLLKAALVSASWVCSFVAIKHLPISFAAPIRSFSPLVTLLGAVLLFAEMPTAMQWLGMLLVFGGYFGFAWVGRKEGLRLEANRYVGLLLLGTFLGASSGLLDKFLLQRAGLSASTVQFFFTFYNTVLQALLLGILWRGGRFRFGSFRFTWWAPTVGFLLVLVDQFYFRAIEQEGALISIVSLVRRSSLLITFAIGGLVFREKRLREKSLYLALLAAGLFVLLL